MTRLFLLTLALLAILPGAAMADRDHPEDGPHKSSGSHSGDDHDDGHRSGDDDGHHSSDDHGDDDHNHGSGDDHRHGGDDDHDDDNRGRH